MDRRHTEAWNWRMRGATVDQIADNMGINRTTVVNYLNAAMDARALPDRVQQLRLELDRLDRYQYALDVQIAGGLFIARNVEVAVRLMERRAKLLGLDAPEQINAAITQVGPEDLEVVELVNAARARLALVERAWRGELPAGSSDGEE
jgi:DNA-binding CsgD family transcriptional regulator